MWCPGTCRRVRATGAPLLPVVHPRPRTRRPDTYEPQGAIELLVVSDPVQPLTAAYSRTASRRRRGSSMSTITVTWLKTYPLKSCAAVHLREARITPRGLEHDRDFMVVDGDNDFVSQRKVPELALV